MDGVNGGPVASHDEALAVAAVLQQRAAERGITLRAPPPAPVGCCGRGCHGCVWEGYHAAFEYWRAEALLRLEP